MFDFFKRQFRNREDGLSAIELTVGMVIFIAVSVGVTALIISSNQQVADSSETAFLNNKINVASQLIGREIAEATDIISVTNDEVVLENNNGTSTVIKAAPIEPTNPASQCKVNITRYAANGETILEDLEVVTELESCSIFTENNNQVNFNLQIMSSDETVYSVSSVASTGYYSGTNDIGGFEVAAVIGAPQGVGIENSGIDAIGRNNILLSWDAVEGASNYVLQASTDGISWYIVNAYVLNNVFDVENLVPETTYYFRVAAQSAEGVGAYSETYSATTLPGSVTTAPVVTYVPSPTSLAINWEVPSDNGGYPINGYKVRYKLATENDWIEATTDASTLTYSIFGLAKYTVYDIEVQALNFKGYSPSGSPLGEVRTLATPPSEVIDLLADPLVNGSSVQLDWSAPLDNGGVASISYDIEYKESDSETWLTTTSTEELTKTVTGLKKYVTYNFRVRATNIEGSSDWVSRTAQTLATVPDAPRNLTADEVETDSFRATWDSPIDTGMDGISVLEYRVTISLNGNVISETTISGDQTNYTFTGLTRGTTYTYSVKASNSVKGFGAAATETQKTAILPPNAPELSFVAKTNNTVTVSWDYPTDDGGDPVVSYNVYNGNTKVNTSPIPAGTTEYTITGLTQLTTYTFYVTASNSHPDEGAKQATGLTVTTHPDPPCTPTGLTLTGYDANTLTVGWSVPCGVIEGYKVYLNGSYVGQVQDTSFTFNDLTPSTQYVLGVAATNITGDSSTASITRATSSGEVVGLEVTSIGTTTSTISWGEPAGSVTNYKIYLAVDNGEILDYQYIGTTTNTQYNFTGLDYNTKYRFGVVAVNSFNVDSQREVVSGTTKPEAVGSLTVGERTTSTIALSWSAPTSGNATITGYNIYLDGVLYDTINNATTTSYVVGELSQLTSNTFYNISVRAKNESGVGEDNTIRVKTRVTIPLAVDLEVTFQNYDEITIEWTKPAGVIDGYKIFISEGANTEPQLFDIVMNEDQLSYTFGTGQLYGGLVGNAPLKDTTQYTVGVIAANGIINDGGDSAITKLNTATTVRPPIEVESTNHTTTSITLNWGCRADNAPSVFKVYVDDAFITDVPLTEGCANTNAATPTYYSYTITGLTQNVNYKLSVLSSIAEGVASPSVDDFTATLAEAPYELSQDVANTTATSIKVSWVAPEGNAITGYKVYLNNVAVSSLEADTATTSYTFTGLDSSTAYNFKVKALTAGGYSADSITVDIATKPEAPVLSKSGNETTTSYAVEWTKPSGTISSYVLEYKLSTSGTWTTVNIANPNTTTYLIEGLTGGKAYNTRIKAVGLSSLESSYSNQLNVTTLLPAPTTVTPGATTTSTIAVSWSAVTDAASYDVFLNGVFLSNVAGTSTTLTGLNYGTTYTIGVKTVNSAGIPSSNITTANGTTVTAAPASVTVTSVTHNSATISWTAPSGSGTPSQYKIYNGSTLVDTVSSSTTSYTITGLNSATNYTGATAAGVATVVTTGGSESAKTTADYLTTPSAPATSSVTSTTSTITVSWGEVSGIVTGYRVYNGSTLAKEVAPAPTIVNSASMSSTATTMPVPSGAQIGDVLLYVWTSDTQAMLTPTGFTGATYNGNTAFGGYAYKTISGTVDTSISGLQNARGVEDVHMLFILRNVTTTGFVAGTFATAGTLAPDAPSITAPANSLVLALGHLDDDAVAASVTAPSGYTLALAAQGGFATGMVATKFSSAGGTENPAAFGTGLDDSWVAQTLAFPATAAVASLTHTFTGLNSNTEYSNLKIVAYNASGEGNVTTFSGTTLPDAPTGLSVTTTETTATLTWTPPSGSETSGFKLYNGVNLVTTVGSGQTSYTFTGLTGSTGYTFGVAAVNAGGDSTTATVAGTTRLAAATALSLTSATTSSISFSWTSPQGSKSGYKIFIDGVLNQNVADATTNSTVRTGSISGLQFGRTYAISIVYYLTTTGDGTATSSVNMATLMAAPATAAQTSGNNNGSTYSATITWTAPSGSGTVSGYRVYVGGVLNGSTITAPTTTTTLTGLTVGTTYAVTIAAISSGGIETVAGSRIAVSTVAGAPTTSAATSVSQTTATLNWTARSAESGYRLYNGATLVATLPIGTTSYNLTGLTAGTTYAAGAWTLRTFNVNGESTATNLPAFTTKLGIPTGLTINAATTTNDTIGFTFTSPAGVKTGYKVYVDGVLNKTVADTTNAATSRSNTVTGLNFGKTYAISVAYYNATGDGIATIPVNMATLTAAPATVAQTAGNNNGTTYSAEITWTAPSNGTVDGYKVYVDDTLNSSTLSNDTLTYTVTGLTVGTTYVVSIATISAEGIETLSANRRVVTTIATAPVTTAATDVLDVSITLNWTASTAESGYLLYRGETLVATLPIGTTSYNITGLDSGTTYPTGTWSLKTFNINGESTSTNFSSITTLLAAPVFVSTTSTTTSITVDWNPPTGDTITGYKVYIGGNLVQDNVVPLPTGQAAFTTPGTYTWTAPEGVTSVSVVAVGAGGAGAVSANGATGGGAGGLGWKNNITVIPGETYTVVVGAGGQVTGLDLVPGNGGDSYFINASTVAGLGGEGGKFNNASAVALGGGFVGDGGGNGGNSGASGGTTSVGGAGGAGGYSGNGGDGGSGNGATTAVAGGNGTGGAAGGGGNGGSADASGAGGGVGILGEGASGTGGAGSTGNGTSGQGGSGGADGSASPGNTSRPSTGGAYGGAGGGADGTYGEQGPGAGGAVRIIWGEGRSFPSTLTTDQSNNFDPTVYTFTGLNPNTIYDDIQIIAYNGSGDGAPLNVTASTLASQPTLDSPAVTNVTKTSATLNWLLPTSGNALTGYKVYLDGAFVTTLSASTTSYNFTGLTAGITYTLGVAAVTEGGDSALRTTTATALLGAATSLALNPATTTTDTIGFTFTSPAGVKTGYYVYLNDTLVKTASDTTTAATSRSNTVSGLEFGKTYNIKIVYYNATGTSPDNINANLSTLMATPASAAQTSGNTNGTTYNAVVTWTAPSGTGTVASYKIYSGSTLVGQVDSATLSFNVGGGTGITGATANNTALTVGTNYTVSIAAVSSEGIETVSGSRRTVTTVSATPTTSAPTLSAENNTQAILNWNAESAVSGYRVYYGSTVLAVLPRTATNYTMSNEATSGVTGGIQAGTDYAAGTWTIKSFNVNGESTATNFPAFTTYLSAPTLFATTSTTTSITIDWTTPSGNNLSGYKVYNDGVLVADIPMTGSPVGQAEWTTPGTYTWTAPVGVTSVSAVAIGGGGGAVWGSAASGGGAGGGLGWKNNITVVPGQTYTVVVGDAGNNDVSNGTTNTATAGGDSYFISSITVAGNGGAGGNYNLSTGAAGGTFVGDGGGNGGNGGFTTSSTVAGGGGGAGGYSGNGGNGGSSSSTAGVSGTGGAGAGGAASASGGFAGNGGGVGIYGEGTSGAGSTTTGTDGGAGSNGVGLQFGAGVGAVDSTTGLLKTQPGNGAVRIIWGTGRNFPSTMTADQTIYNPNSYTISGLTPNTVYANIDVIAYNATGESLPLEVVASTLAEQPTLAAASVTSVGKTVATLNWELPISGDALTGYKMYLDGVYLTTVSASTTSYQFTGLTAGTTYTLGVAAVTAGGDSTLRTASTTTLLGAATGLTINSGTTTTSVIGFNFTSPAGVKTGYYVYLNDTLVNTVSDTTTAATSRSNTVTGLEFGKTYNIKIVYYNASGTSPDSIDSNLSTLMAAPATAAQTSGNTNGSTYSAVITWTAPSGTGTVKEYKVYKDGVLEATVTAPTVTYTVTDLTVGTNYAITIAAVSTNTGFTSIETLSASRRAVTTAAVAPSTNAATSVSQTTATLNWTARTAESGYRLYNGVTLVATLPIGTTSYNLTGLTAGTTYPAGTWTLKTFNVNGESSATNFPSMDMLLGSATGLAIDSGTTTIDTIGFNFTSPLGTKTGYKVYVDGVLNKTVPDTTNAATLRSDTVTGLAFGKTYAISIVYYNASGDGIATTPVNMATLMATPATASQTAGNTNGTTYSAEITWTAPSGTGTVSGYKVYVDGILNSTTLSNETLTYTVTGLTVGTTYAVTVAAISSESIETTVANRILVTTSSAVPATAAATEVLDVSATLNWDAASGVSGYQVYNGETLVATLSSSTTSYGVAGLDSGTTYPTGTWTLKTFNVNGQSTAVDFPAITTLLAAPVLSSTTSTTTSITVDWNPPNGDTITGYKVYIGGNLVQDNVVPLPTGQAAFTTPGTYTWTAPEGVTSVSVVAVGAGGAGAVSNNGATGGGAGGLGWKNNITVIPGETYTVVVGAGGQVTGLDVAPGNGGDSYFINTSTVAGLGGEGGKFNDAVAIALGGGFVGDGGGNGGNSGASGGTTSVGGAGGAGGYSGNGGDGGSGNGAASAVAGGNGTGGAAGGGGNGGSLDASGAGGGVGILGEGSSGTGGAGSGANGSSGQGGSGGADGSASPGAPTRPSTGGAYGGAGGASDGNNGEQGPGAGGAVRIIWGEGRSFPSTLTTDQSNNFDPTVYTFTGLAADTLYDDIQIIAYNGSGDGAPLNVSEYTAPSAPAGLNSNASGITKTSITLNWNAVSGANISNYKLYLNGSYRDTVAVGTNSYTFTGLTAGTTYTLGVVASNAGADSTTSTTTSTTKLEAATGLTINSGTTTTDTVGFTFTSPAGVKTGYYVYLNDNLVNTVSDTMTNATSRSNTVSGLEFGKTYNIKIAYYHTTAGTGDVTSNVAMSTLMAAPASAAQTSGDNNGTTYSAEITWTAPTGTGTVKEYKVYKDGVLESTVTAPTVTYNVTGLTVGINYAITIAAVSTDNIETATSSRILVTTSSAVPTTAATEVLDVSATLNWDTASGVSGYQVYNGANLIATVASTVTSYNVTGLNSGTTYSAGTWSLRTFNVNGQSNSVNFPAFTTLLGAPTLSSTTSTTNSVTVNWSAPSGTITGYKVYRSGVLQDTLSATVEIQNPPIIINSSAQSANSTTMPVPSGAELGDILLYVWTSDTQNMLTPTGFTGVAYSGNSAVGGYAYKTISGSIDTEITGLQNARTNEDVHMLFIIRGGTTTGLVEGVFSTGLSGAPNPPSISNVPVNALVLALGHLDDDAVASSVTAPSGYTLALAAQGGFATGMVASKVSTGGTEDAAAFGGTGVDDAWVANKIAIPSASAPVGTPTSSYTFSGLSANTVYSDLQIVAYNAGGNGAPLNVNVSTLASAPNGLNITNITATTVQLNWSAPSGNATTGHKIYLSGNLITTVPAGDTSYILTGLTANTTYTTGAVTILHVSSGGDSLTSPFPTFRTVPSQVTGLSIGTVTSTGVGLSWNAVSPSTGVTYVIERSTDQTNWSNITSTSSTSTAATGLTQNTMYYFRVKATNATGDGLYSAIANTPTVPNSPTGLNFTGATVSTASFSWNAVTGGTEPISYTVYKDGVEVETISGTTYTLTGLSSGTAYTFEVRAYNNTRYSTTGGATISAQTVPAAPTSVTVTDRRSNTIDISWTAPIGTPTYKVYVDGVAVQDGGSDLVLASGTTSYQFTGLTSGTNYTVGVRAVTTGGQSSISTVNASTTIDPVSNLSISSVTSSSFTASWTAPSGTPSGYKIYLNGEYNQTVTGTSVNMTGLDAGTNYTIGVAAYNADGDATIIEASTVTTISAPTGLTASSVTGQSMTVSWTAPAGSPTGYKISLNDSYLTTVFGATSYNINGLTPNTSYSIAITAIKGEAESSSVGINQTTVLAGVSGFNYTTRSTTSINVGWNAPSTGLSTVYLFKDGVYVTQLGSTTFGYSFTGLTAGTSYTFGISTINSSPSNIQNTVTVATPATTPTDSSVSPVYVGGQTATILSTATKAVNFSLTGGIASVPAIGDTVVVSYAVNGAATNRAYNISGYTQVADLFQTDTESINLFVGYKQLTAADTSVTFTSGSFSSTQRATVAIQVWRNISPTVLDVTPKTAVLASQILPPVASTAITPVTPEAVIITAGGAAHTGGVDTFASTQFGSNFLTVGGDSTDDASIGMGWFNWSSGTFTPTAWTSTQSTSLAFSSAAVTLALRPADLNTVGLSAPTGLSYLSTLNLLSWNAVANATGYNIYLDGSYIGTTTDTAFNTISLAAGKTNTLTVRAYKGTVLGSPSSWHVTAPFAEPSIPQTLSISGVTSTSATLNWTAPATSGYGTATSYTVYLDGAPVATNLSSGTTSYTFNGLNAGRGYVLSVAAVNGGGTSRIATTQLSARGDVVTSAWSDLGTPLYTLGSSGSGVGHVNQSSNAVVVFDATINSNTSGVLFEIGGTTNGLTIGMDAGGTMNIGAFGGTVWQGSEQSWISTNVSSYYNTPGVWAVAASWSERRIRLYFNNTLVATGTVSTGATNIWGTNGYAVGTINNGAATINTTANFTNGTINSVTVYSAPTRITP